MPPFNSQEFFAESPRRPKTPGKQQLTPSVKKSISFSSRESVYVYECDCHKQNSWLSGDEMDDIREDVHHTVKAMMSRSLHKHPEMCDRGLESKTPAGSIQILARQRYARGVVLREQERQRNEMICQPEKLAAEYAKATSKSKVIAAALGRGDQVSAC